MKEKHWNFEKTLEFVKSRKQNTKPNFGFIRQLRLFDEEIKCNQIKF